MTNSTFSTQTTLGTSGITAGTYGNGSNSLQLTVNSNGIISAISAVPFTSINGAQIAGFKNTIINGGMQVWQRGTSFSPLPTPGSLIYTADRWGAACNFNNSEAHVFQSTDAPAGFHYSLGFGRISSSSGVGVPEIAQAFETANSIPLAGQTVTLSYYGKTGTTWSASPNVLVVQIFTSTGTDQSVVNMLNSAWAGNAIALNANDSLTTSWTRYQHTFNIGAGVTQVGALMYWSPSGTAGADDNVYITGVQLEVGNSATAFENRSFGEELKLCQRYFNKTFAYATAPANSIGSNTGETQWDYTRIAASQTSHTPVRWPISMRAAPSISFYNVTNANAQARDITSGGDCSSTSAININDKGMTISTLGYSSSAQGHQIAVHWVAAAEL